MWIMGWDAALPTNATASLLGKLFHSPSQAIITKRSLPVNAADTMSGVHITPKCLKVPSPCNAWRLVLEPGYAKRKCCEVPPSLS
jgi:hypothetical protein